MAINEPLPEQVSVSSTRRILIGLNLSEYEAGSLISAIYEARSYLEANSDGGWRSDPQILLRLEQAVQAELSHPGQGIPAPGAGAFLADGSWSTDEDDPPGDADPGESENRPFGPGAGSAPASSPSASSEEPKQAAPASPAGSQTASPAVSEPSSGDSGSDGRDGPG